MSGSKSGHAWTGSHDLARAMLLCALSRQILLKVVFIEKRSEIDSFVSCKWSVVSCNIILVSGQW